VICLLDDSGLTFAHQGTFCIFRRGPSAVSVEAEADKNLAAHSREPISPGKTASIGEAGGGFDVQFCCSFRQRFVGRDLNPKPSKPGSRVFACSCYRSAAQHGAHQADGPQVDRRQGGRGRPAARPLRASALPSAARPRAPAPRLLPPQAFTGRELAPCAPVRGARRGCGAGDGRAPATRGGGVFGAGAASAAASGQRRWLRAAEGVGSAARVPTQP